MKSGLYVACREGHIDVIKLLIDKFLNDEGCDINIKDIEGFYVACQNGRINVIKFLIDKGCFIDMNSVDIGNATGFHLATGFKL